MYQKVVEWIKNNPVESVGVVLIPIVIFAVSLYFKLGDLDSLQALISEPTSGLRDRIVAVQKDTEFLKDTVDKPQAGLRDQTRELDVRTRNLPLLDNAIRNTTDGLVVQTVEIKTKLDVLQQILATAVQPEFLRTIEKKDSQLADLRNKLEELRKQFKLAEEKTSTSRGAANSSLSMLSQSVISLRSEISEAGLPEDNRRHLLDRIERIVADIESIRKQQP